MENISLSELIAWIESRDTTAAIRFEPATYAKFDNAAPNKVVMDILARIKSANRCSDATARMIYSTSFGAHQLMGFNIYADDFPMPIGEYLVSQSAQQARFLAFLKRAGLQDFTPDNLAKNHDSRLKFAIKYNGSIVYEQAILQALHHFGLPLSG
jgi:hypothetical protein